MAFRINTNITALRANIDTNKTSNKLTASLSNLSSGLRINKAADDASLMSIADSLRAQADGLGKAIANGNDAIGILQTADNAMAEQIEIMEIIRVKSIQAANDAQTRQSRAAIQQDIMRLLEEFDNIANTTSFNGQKLLNGNFSNKHFQIGAYSNETIDISIGNTNSNTLGHLTYNTSDPLIYQVTNDFKDAQWRFSINYGINETKSFTFSGQDLLDRGLKTITDQVNSVSVETGIRAFAKADVAGPISIQARNNLDLKINGVTIMSHGSIQWRDANYALTSAINNVSSITGVTAVYGDGRLMLQSKDGLPIDIECSDGASLGLLTLDPTTNDPVDDMLMLGEITFSKQGAANVSYSITAENAAAGNQKGVLIPGVSNEGKSKFEDNTATFTTNINLREFAMKGVEDSPNVLKALGYGVVGGQGTFGDGQVLTAGVTTYEGAQIMIDISVAALKDLDRIRADIGSAQNQIISTINNIATTQINVKAAESQLRDVDFAIEAANFNKQNILMQSGSYSLAQANTIQQNVMRLLQ